jgi:hypothetical protein
MASHPICPRSQSVTAPSCTAKSPGDAFVEYCRTDVHRAGSSLLVNRSVQDVHDRIRAETGSRAARAVTSRRGLRVEAAMSGPQS